ncbi:hypothetical protein F751_5918 [Auxenochlorella protothecoides]|uniref:Uncharacterized protein n=1 Tax=Auxenochlorella protothecoides TaxID=3075 RepID=A0A087SR10_AUXPR|nr:hypothetical protein F751_5918 [Auxenochlorella protothecoides]KFM28164.1 hypothetical protein F751_5918 [Auxenochlorella protothecoides]
MASPPGRNRPSRPASVERQRSTRWTQRGSGGRRRRRRRTRRRRTGLSTSAGPSSLSCSTFGASRAADGTLLGTGGRMATASLSPCGWREGLPGPATPRPAPPTPRRPAASAPAAGRPWPPRRAGESPTNTTGGTPLQRTPRYTCTSASTPAGPRCSPRWTNTPT